MRDFIHVGCPKSGTTMLQASIFPQQDNFAYLGKFYSEETRNGAHRLQSAIDIVSFLDRYDQSGSIDGLDELAKTIQLYSPDKGVLISDEALTNTYSTPLLQKFRLLTTVFREPDFLITMRDPFTHLTSLYLWDLYCTKQFSRFFFFSPNQWLESKRWGARRSTNLGPLFTPIEISEVHRLDRSAFERLSCIFLEDIVSGAENDFFLEKFAIADAKSGIQSAFNSGLGGVAYKALSLCTSDAVTDSNEFRAKLEKIGDSVGPKIYERLIDLAHQAAQHQDPAERFRLGVFEMIDTFTKIEDPVKVTIDWHSEPLARLHLKHVASGWDYFFRSAYPAKPLPEWYSRLKRSLI